jgi:hypothetical protein
MVNLSSYAIGLSAVLSKSAVQAQQLANNRLSVVSIVFIFHAFKHVMSMMSCSHHDVEV